MLVPDFVFWFVAGAISMLVAITWIVPDHIAARWVERKNLPRELAWIVVGIAGIHFILILWEAVAYRLEPWVLPLFLVAALAVTYLAKPEVFSRQSRTAERVPPPVDIDEVFEDPDFEVTAPAPTGADES